MSFVLDCSATMGWCFADQADSVSEAALDALENGPAWVPTLWSLEVANVLLLAEKRGKLTVAQRTCFVQRLLALPIQVDPATPGQALLATLALGSAHGLSAYDAAYLELALRTGLPFATRDARLAAVCEALGVARVGL